LKYPAAGNDKSGHRSEIFDKPSTLECNGLVQTRARRSQSAAFDPVADIRYGVTTFPDRHAMIASIIPTNLLQYDARTHPYPSSDAGSTHCHI